MSDKQKEFMQAARKHGFVAYGDGVAYGQFVEIYFDGLVKPRIKVTDWFTLDCEDAMNMAEELECAVELAEQAGLIASAVV